MDRIAKFQGGGEKIGRKLTKKGHFWDLRKNYSN